MVLYSDLRNWVNGNISDIDKDGLIKIAIYYQNNQEESDIEYDVETDEEYTGVPDDSPDATHNETEEYICSVQEDTAIAADERGIHIGEHGGDLNE